METKTVNLPYFTSLFLSSFGQEGSEEIVKLFGEKVILICE